MNFFTRKHRFIFSTILVALLLFTATAAWADGETGELVGHPSLKHVEGTLNGDD